VSIRLSNCAQGRDNNFNLIRIVAAFAVLVTHSFAFSIGTGDAEPFRAILGMTMGKIAVDVFFITSGFLVTASLFTRQSVIEFVWARVLRILPALVVMLLLTVFVLGAFFTSLPLSSYFLNKETYIYFIKCSTLFGKVAFNLPGVFENNPYKNDVNSSLWTIPYEVRMYAILAVTWVALRITRENRLKRFKLIVVVYAVLSGIYVLIGYILSFNVGGSIRLSFMFFTGAAFYILKERIVLSRWFFWFIMIVLSLAIGHVRVFVVVYTLSIAYLLFFLAYVPSGNIRKYNLLGDYSYGVYIYACPIQQSVAALIPGVSVLHMFLISAPITILLGVISWHFLERRVLALKGQCASYTKDWFRRCLKIA